MFATASITLTIRSVSEIVLELGRRESLYLCEAARELGLDLFSATLILGSILVDPSELELHAVYHAIPTLDHGFVVCSPKLIDHVLVLLDLLDLGVNRRRRRFEGVDLLKVGAVARRLASSGVVYGMHAVQDCYDQG